MSREDDVELGGMASTQFATTVIRLKVSPEVDDAVLQDHFVGIGHAVREFQGFRSRKIIEVPCEDKGRGRMLVVILKFVGSSPEEAFGLMSKWNDSEELVEWQARANRLGIESVERETRYGSAKVDLQQSAKGATGPPPKWKIGLVIEVWVFIFTVVNAFAGTGPAIYGAIGNGPFTLFLVLSTVVPIIAYAALPLTLSIGYISKWVRARALRRGDALAILEDGLLLFTPDDVAGDVRHVKARLETLERRLDALQRKKAPDLDQVRQENWVDIDDDVINAADDEDSGGIAIAARHRVRWDAIDDFMAWSEDMDRMMNAYPGFLGSDVFRSDTGARDFVAVFRFDNFVHLEAWLASDDRAEQLVALEPFVEGSSVFANLGTSLKIVASAKSPETTNLLGQLLVSEGDHFEPAVYKSCVLTVVGLFLVAWPISAHLGPVLEALPFPLGILVSTSTTVFAETYIGAPFINFIFGGWLKKLPPPPTRDDVAWIKNLKTFLVVGPKTALARVLILFFYFLALALAIVF